MPTRLKTSTAPSQSVGDAGRTARPQTSPRVSTSRCRLRPATFFPPVVPLRAAALGRLHRLAVDDPGAGRRLPPVGTSDLGPEGVVDLLPHPGVPPRVEVVADRLPRREVVGQHPPGAPAPRQVEDGVDHLPQRVLPGPPGRAVALREQVADVVPLEVGQVARVSLPCIGTQADRVPTARNPAEGHFLDGQ